MAPMLTVLIAIFVLVYVAIALEHPLKVNKSATALLGAGLLWTVYALAGGNATDVNAQLGESLLGTAQIVFFLMGAMTIVEVVDAHNGFEVITSRIKTAKLSQLMLLPVWACTACSNTRRTASCGSSWPTVRAQAALF
jgi:Na+/H+ antiporter NhaD/arsenite permease-like protein